MCAHLGRVWSRKDGSVEADLAVRRQHVGDGGGVDHAGVSQTHAGGETQLGGGDIRGRPASPSTKRQPQRPPRQGSTSPVKPNSRSTPQLSPNSTWLVASRHVSTRHDTLDVSSPRILAVSSLSNSTARHARHDELELLDTLVSTLSTCIATCRVEPSGIWALERTHSRDSVSVRLALFRVSTRLSLYSLLRIVVITGASSFGGDGARAFPLHFYK